MANREEVMNRAVDLGIYCATWSPGDGITRYRFFLSLENADQNYFGPANGDFTALGAKEALTFLDGVKAGIELELRKQEV